MVMGATPPLTRKGHFFLTEPWNLVSSVGRSTILLKCLLALRVGLLQPQELITFVDRGIAILLLHEENWCHAIAVAGQDPKHRELLCVCVSLC